MKFIKRYFFLIILIVTGSVYLAFTDYREVYARPLEKIKEWYGRLEGVVESGAPDAGQVSGNTVPDGIVSEGNAGEGDGGENTVAADGTQESLSDAEKDVQDTGDVGNGTGPAPEGTDTETDSPETLPVPRSPEEVEYIAVEDDYFSDAVFIGDSRTVGMFEYGGLEEISTFYASTGLTVYKLFEAPIVSVPGQKEKQTVEQALSENRFSKIYLMIGINEMGTGTVESFIEKYKEVLAHLKELQPDAIIYIQAIMKVTTARSDQGDYITNEGIDARNAELAKLADYVQVYYLDVNPVICDATGGMEPSYTFDGVHLKAQYVPVWKEFLKSHAVAVQ